MLKSLLVVPAVMGSLYSESALKTAKIEGAQHLEELKRQGALGIERPVKIRAKKWTGMHPEPGCKVVHMVRHGQGFHNLLGDLYRDMGKSVDSTGADAESPYTRPELEDPPLTAIGRDQAKQLQGTTSKLDIELVIVSPLCRAVQTANLAMPHLKKQVKWLAHDDVIEASGVNICDKRRSKSEILDDFPHLDLALIRAEDDDMWTSDKRESAVSVSDRAHRWLLWLRARPETHVALVTHSAFLFTMLQTALVCDPPELADWFLTGELRSFLVSFDDDDPRQQHADERHCSPPENGADPAADTNGPPDPKKPRT